MKIIIYLLIFIVAAYLGYKIAEVTITNKQIKNNVTPVVEELQSQLKAIQDKLMIGNLTESEKIELETRKNQLVSILGKFYGYTKSELENLLKK